MSRKVRQLQKFYQRSYTVILTDLFNAIKKLRKKISFHKHFIFVKYDLLTEYPTVFWFDLLVSKCKLVFRIRIRKSSKECDILTIFTFVGSIRHI